MTTAFRYVFAMGVICSLANAATAQDAPRTVGQCVETKIFGIWSLNGDMVIPFNENTYVTYANGVSGVGDNVVQEMRNSRVGDPVVLCLVSVPAACPDGLGKVYSAVNSRTKQSWSLPDAQKVCGGF